MKKFSIILSALFLIGSLSIYASHNWKRINYMGSTVFSAYVTINGKPAKKGDVVGAFAGDECRMIADVFINNDTAYVSSVIHGIKKETIVFKVWIQEEDSSYTVKETIQSNPGGSIHLHHIDLKK